ncbi:hypothetical protein [Streptomyces sp. AcE210]|uniref:hypothetical protein n=1 Tax=Streptomyces sp. AcE210 TaxID=2292703 RepID=UPI0010588A2D|nr:hypothetical protein [Streptomyces sp. AcE210]
MPAKEDQARLDLIPNFGTRALDQLGHRHIAAFATSQLAGGRRQVTLSRCLATLWRRRRSRRPRRTISSGRSVSRR